MVVDNGSPQNACPVLAAEYPQVNFIRNEDNRGYGQACNQGAALVVDAKCCYVFFLNADTIVAPNAIGRLVSFMQSNPRCGACGPRLLDFRDPPRTQNLGYRYHRWFGTARPIGAGKPPDWLPRQVGPVDWVMGAALFVSAEALRATGGFDPVFFFYWEDVYLCWDAHRQGHEIQIAADAVVRHRKTVGSEFSHRHIYHMLHGQVTFIRRTARWYQTPTIAFGLAAVVTVMCAYSLVRAREWTLPSAIRAILDAITRPITAANLHADGALT